MSTEVTEDTGTTGTTEVTMTDPMFFCLVAGAMAGAAMCTVTVIAERKAVPRYTPVDPMVAVAMEVEEEGDGNARLDQTAS
jgi:hypothetical protein